MKKFSILLFVVCLGIMAILFFEKTTLVAAGLHFNVLLLGNFLLALVSLVTYRMNVKGRTSQNAGVFVRLVMGAMLLKMMFVLVGVLVYVLAYRPLVSKPTIFLLLGFYIIYMILETASTFRLQKSRS